VKRDYTYTPPPATHGREQRRTSPGTSHRLIWEIATIAGSLAFMLAFMYLLDLWGDILYFAGF